MKPQFLGEGEGSAMVPLEKAMVVSYRLSIVIVALSVTAICDGMSPTLKSTGGGPKFSGVHLEADPSCWGCKERTSRAN